MFDGQVGLEFDLAIMCRLSPGCSDPWGSAPGDTLPMRLRCMARVTRVRSPMTPSGVRVLEMPVPNEALKNRHPGCPQDSRRVLLGFHGQNAPKYGPVWTPYLPGYSLCMAGSIFESPKEREIMANSQVCQTGIIERFPVIYRSPFPRS
jgi:hypothetical protein